MTAIIINGRTVASRIQDQITKDIQTMQEEHGVTPGLAAVLVGGDPASQMYVRMKRNRCAEVGMHSVAVELPGDITQQQLHDEISALNEDPTIHGILVQLPIPDHIDEEAVLRTVSLNKDVDGFHPINIGRLAMKGRDPMFIPATPYGCMYLLEEAEKLVEGFSISGSNAAILGRSNIVGLPMALLLIHANATVTVIHSRTKDIPDIVSQSDIVIGAMGQPEMIKAAWLKENAVCIDVATVKVDDPSAKKGYVWKGDFEFESAKEKVAAITPVPGGVGPMTIAMLLKNTLKAAELSISN